MSETRPAGEPLVSVVTPTYNNDAFLRECIESVLAQTHKRWEYIVVDDGSTDGTVALARPYAARDERIRVEAHEERLGVPANWNRALREISADSAYCKVVHGDDWLFPDCLERMVALAEREPSVGVVGAYRIDGARVNLDGLPPQTSVVPGAEICRKTLLGDLFVFGSPTSLLVRSDVVRARDPFYPEGSLHADTEVCFEVLRDVDFGFIHQVLTFTRRHPGAVTSYAVRVGTYRPETIDLVRKYGPTFLSQDDYERQLAVAVTEYALFLAGRTGGLRDPEFRAYHRNVVSKLADNLDIGAVARGALRQARKMATGR